MANVSSRDAALQSQRHSKSGLGGGAGRDAGEQLPALGRIQPTDRSLAAEFRHRATHCGATAEANGDFTSNDRLSDDMALFQNLLTEKILPRAGCRSVPTFEKGVTFVF